jgi:hypothetical protein
VVPLPLLQKETMAADAYASAMPFFRVRRAHRPERSDPNPYDPDAIAFALRTLHADLVPLRTEGRESRNPEE